MYQQNPLLIENKILPTLWGISSIAQLVNSFKIANIVKDIESATNKQQLVDAINKPTFLFRSCSKYTLNDLDRAKYYTTWQQICDVRKKALNIVAMNEDFEIAKDKLLDFYKQQKVISLFASVITLLTAIVFVGVKY